MMSIYTDTKLLLHCDGVNGSTDIRDSSLYKQGITVNGNAKISTAQSKFNGSSIYLDTTSTSCVKITESTLLTYSEPFAYSLWFYPLSNAGFIINTGNTGTTRGMAIGMYGGSTLLACMSSASGTWDIFSNGIIGTPTLNTWNYMLITFDGSVYRTYLNGIAGATKTTTLYPRTFSTLILGRSLDNNDIYNGYIDEFQIIVGDSVSQIDPTVVPTYPFSYGRYMPYKDLMEGCVAYWDFRDKSKYDIMSNRLATWSTNRWTTDHLSQLNSAVDIDSTSEQITWTNLGTVGDTLLIINQSGTQYYLWNEAILTTTGINTGATKSTGIVSAILFFDSTISTSKRTEIVNLLKTRYIYPTQQVAMQE